MIWELCETDQTSKLGSQWAASLKNCFQVGRKANRATAPSKGVAGSFRAQTLLPDSGSIKNQRCTTWWILPCMFYKNYLPTFQQTWCLSNPPVLGSEDFNLPRIQRAQGQWQHKLPLSWHCCSSYSGNGTQTCLFLVPWHSRHLRTDSDESCLETANIYVDPQ